MPELILSSKRIEVSRGVYETRWFLDIKYGNRLTDITNGSYTHCLEQKAQWQALIDREELEALAPSSKPHTKPMPL
jgi:hypothetical protein